MKHLKSYEELDILKKLFSKDKEKEEEFNPNSGKKINHWIKGHNTIYNKQEYPEVKRTKPIETPKPIEKSLFERDN